MGCASSSDYGYPAEQRPQFLTGSQLQPTYLRTDQNSSQAPAVPVHSGAMKRALLIGCNYPGSNYELHGCVRDIEKIYPVLQRNFGFNEIRIMLDTQSSYEDSPTGRNIKVKCLST